MMALQDRVGDHPYPMIFRINHQNTPHQNNRLMYHESDGSNHMISYTHEPTNAPPLTDAEVTEFHQAIFDIEQQDIPELQKQYTLINADVENEFKALEEEKNKSITLKSDQADLIKERDQINSLHRTTESKRNELQQQLDLLNLN